MASLRLTIGQHAHHVAVIERRREPRRLDEPRRGLFVRIGVEQLDGHRAPKLNILSPVDLRGRAHMQPVE